MKSTIPKPTPHLLALATLLAAPCGLVSGATTVLQDGMSAPNYSSFSFNGADSGSNPDDISFESSNPVGSVGNPGAYLEAIHSHDVNRNELNGEPLNGDGDTSVQSIFVEQTMTYNPAIDGPIATITFLIDLQITVPFSNVSFGIEDSGGGSISGFTSLPPSTAGWQTFSSGPLTQADFSGRDFSGSDPFKFSFGFISDADVTTGPENFVIGVDNFTIVIESVPEPSSAALVGASILAVGLIRRRHRGAETFATDK